MSEVKALAALEKGGRLEPFRFEMGPLGDDEVEVAVRYCGLCHSDLSMLDNEWGISAYPFVPGHEIVGEVAAVGARVPTVTAGQTVGIGWYSRSCMHCHQCMSGDHNLCGTAEGIIVGRHGGFATRVRAHWAWVLPLPEAVDPAKAGPLFCGGTTVFNPILQNGILPTDRVGVVGIGGLGHLALQFLRAWGCHVTAFSTTPDKEEEAKALGATDFVATRDPDALAKLAGQFAMILVTVNVPLDWDAYIGALKPRGKLHIVGAAPSVSSAVFPLLAGQKSIGASPLGSPETQSKMLDICARHNVAPVVESFPMSKANEALDRLRSGKLRYRAVLTNDLG